MTIVSTKDDGDRRHLLLLKLRGSGLQSRLASNELIRMMIKIKPRLPRKKKKAMKQRYQSIDSNYKITGSLYDGFIGLERTARYYGKIRNWRELWQVKK